MGAIIYSHDNPTPSYIRNCQFYENKGEHSLFDLVATLLVINDSDFFNNTNLAFYTMQTNLNISNVSFSNHVCRNIEGCIFSMTQSSILVLRNSIFENISNLENEGNIVFDSSSVIFEKNVIRNLSTLRKIGSCARLISTNITISEGLFHNYLGNCLFSIESSINISNSNFYNSEIKIFNRK